MHNAMVSIDGGTSLENLGNLAETRNFDNAIKIST